MFYRDLLEEAPKAKIDEESPEFFPKSKQGELVVCVLEDQELRGLYRLYLEQKQARLLMMQEWQKIASSPRGFSFGSYKAYRKSLSDVDDRLVRLANMILLGLAHEIEQVNCNCNPSLLRIRAGWTIVCIRTSPDIMPHFIDPFGELNMAEGLHHCHCHRQEPDPDDLDD
ncbi:MAG: hypothetical protein WC465_01580 [Patescibacteria group bacterium]